MAEDTTAANLTQTKPVRALLNRFGWILLITWMGAVFALESFLLPGLLPVALELYVVRPLLWLILAALAVLVRYAGGEPLAWTKKKDLILIGGMLGGIQVAVTVLLGVFMGFGNSPYAREVQWVVLNLWFIASRLVGLEAARWSLGKSLGKNSPGLGFALAWLLPLLMVIPFGMYSLFGQTESTFRVLGRTILPSAAESLLATTLALAGGPLASIAYRGVMQAVEWISPVLPNLPWLASAFVGVLVPVLGLLAIHRPEPGEVEAAEAKDKKAQSERAPVTSWLLVLALAVGIIWFNSGALGVRPSLVSGNSMNPVLYPGDIVISRETDPAKLLVGDVVRFHRDGIDVVHRIVEITEANGRLTFVTRGDNNNVNDDPVPAEIIEGKVVFTVPKIGWVSIWVRQGLALVGIGG